MSDPFKLFFDEIQVFNKQVGKKFGAALLAQQLKFEEEVRKRELVRIATALPCSRGVSPFRINWRPDVYLTCPECGSERVNVLIVHIECWNAKCNWHRKRKEFRS